MPHSTMKIDPDLRDAARRASDIINQHIADHGWWEIRNKYVAIRLRDGGSDGVLYDTKRDAVRHQLDERFCAYVCFRSLGPNGAVPRELEVFLQFCRNVYDKGHRLTDPDDLHGGRVPIPTDAHNIAVRREISKSVFEMELEKMRRKLGL